MMQGVDVLDARWVFMWLLCLVFGACVFCCCGVEVHRAWADTAVWVATLLCQRAAFGVCEGVDGVYMQR